MIGSFDESIRRSSWLCTWVENHLSVTLKALLDKALFPTPGAYQCANF